MATPKMRDAEIVTILRNSPKGQLKYENGWDQSPQAIWQLVSQVQAEADQPKVAIIERALRVTRLSEQRNKSFEDARSSPVGTSSGSGSRITLFENDSDSNGCNGNCKGKSPKPKKRPGYGIREDEYDDEALSREFEYEFIPEVRERIAYLLKEFDDKIKKDVAKKVQKKRKEYEAFLKKRDADVNEAQEKFRRENSLKNLSLTILNEEADGKIMAQVEADRMLRKIQNETLDLFYENKQKAVTEARRLENEKAAKFAATEATKIAAANAEQERQKQINAQIAAQDQRNQQEQEELQRIKKEEYEAALKLEAQRLISESKKEQSVSTALQGMILKEDCDVYNNCSNFILQYEEATKDISSSNNAPNIKKFYSGAINCINTPMNSVANTDPNVIAQRTSHFIDMIEGKPVVGSSSMTSHFRSSDLPNGRPFVLRLLAFRFVKKAESEILSEKKGFIPLATIGVTISKKFPEFGALVRAYFYKQCPFLVPFSFPRADKSVSEYCISLGYDIKGEGSIVLNELLGRIRGYCSLYAIMVQTFEKNGQFDIGEATSFFTIGGVWQILTKTLKLEPQPDVTVVVIQSLLELMSDHLLRVYGRQFQKLMIILISTYLPKIDSISYGASKAGVNRFQTFLEQKFNIRPR